MEFSVLMSVYKKDNSDFFKSAIESVTVNQTRRPNQVVIIQDGPVSETINDIIQQVHSEVREIEFTVVKLIQNRGLAAALNVGIDACKYEWIARMDSDDISLPSRFEKQIEYISKNPTVDIVGGMIEEFENTPGDIQSVRQVRLVHEEIVTMSKKRTPMNHVTVMYKKISLINAGKYSENFGKLEDYKLWIDMILHDFRFANISDILVFVRVGNGFIKRRSNHNEIVDWDALQFYLLDAGFVSKINALRNRIYIRVFINMPACFKKIIYKTILRK